MFILLKSFALGVRRARQTDWTRHFARAVRWGGATRTPAMPDARPQARGHCAPSQTPHRCPEGRSGRVCPVSAASTGFPGLFSPFPYVRSCQPDDRLNPCNALMGQKWSQVKRAHDFEGGNATSASTAKGSGAEVATTRRVQCRPLLVVSRLRWLIGAPRPQAREQNSYCLGALSSSARYHHRHQTTDPWQHRNQQSTPTRGLCPRDCHRRHTGTPIFPLQNKPLEPYIVPMGYAHRETYTLSPDGPGVRRSAALQAPVSGRLGHGSVSAICGIFAVIP